MSFSQTKNNLKFKIENKGINNITIFIKSDDISQNVYVIKKGDTLSEIAFKYKTTVRKLAKVNNIKNIHLIYPNVVLKLD